MFNDTANFWPHNESKQYFPTKSSVRDLDLRKLSILKNKNDLYLLDIMYMLEKLTIDDDIYVGNQKVKKFVNINRA